MMNFRSGALRIQGSTDEGFDQLQRAFMENSVRGNKRGIMFNNWRWFYTFYAFYLNPKLSLAFVDVMCTSMNKGSFQP